MSCCLQGTCITEIVVWCSALKPACPKFNQKTSSSLGAVFVSSTTRLKTPWGGFNYHFLFSHESADDSLQPHKTWLACDALQSMSQTNIFTGGICAFTCSKTVGSPQVFLKVPSNKPLSFPEENLLCIILSCCVSVGSS